MFALWCAVKSPLMLGMDLRQLEVGDVAFEIITNSELIEVNQDPLGVQATCVKDCCGKGPLGGNIPMVTCPHYYTALQIWQGHLENGAFVVVIVNR